MSAGAGTDYSKLSTNWLGKMLDGAAEGSAVQKAIQEELRSREIRRPDKDTLHLFDAEQWKSLRTK